MSIKYAEITLNRKCFDIDTDIFTSFLGHFWREEVYNEDTIIVLFDDNTIYDTRNSYSTRITFSPNNKTSEYIYQYPVSIIIDKDSPTSNTLFCSYNYNASYSNFKYKIFKDFNRSSLLIRFNVLYHKYSNNFDTDFIGITHINSNVTKPRFALAYDSNIMNKTDVLYIVDSIFRKNPNSFFW
jgi:hypothetical protein